MFKKNGWIDNEFIDAVIYRWRYYDEFQYLFQDGTRIILPTQATTILDFLEKNKEFKPVEVAQTMEYLIGEDDLTKADKVNNEQTNMKS